MAVDIPPAGAVVAYYKYPATTSMVEIAPLGLALLEVFIYVPLHSPKQAGGQSEMTFPCTVFKSMLVSSVNRSVIAPSRLFFQSRSY